MLTAGVFPFRSMVFFEAFWHGEAIGDGGDLEEALAAFRAVQSEQSEQSDGICWSEACADPAAQPHLRRYASFEAYLDNADELETIAVTAAMIEAALQELV